jgi:hypothetical protein
LHLCLYPGNIQQKQTAKNGVEGQIFSIDYWQTYQYVHMKTSEDMNASPRSPPQMRLLAQLPRITSQNKKTAVPALYRQSGFSFAYPFYPHPIPRFLKAP